MKNGGVIIYGGSFDPPHRGHQACALAALKQFPTATLWILPNPFPAGAAAQHKNPWLDFSERYRLCQKIFSDLGDRCEVRDDELQLAAPNYALQTLLHVREAKPDACLAMLMGADQWESFDRWHEPRRILEHCDIMVAPRPGSGSGHFQQDVRDVLERLNLSAEQIDNHQVQTTLGHRVVALQMEPLAVSSTEIREAHRSPLNTMSKERDDDGRNESC